MKIKEFEGKTQSSWDNLEGTKIQREKYYFAKMFAKF